MKKNYSEFNSKNSNEFDEFIEIIESLINNKTLILIENKIESITTLIEEYKPE